MLGFTESFDEYSRRARMAPILFVLLPLGLAYGAWFPDGNQHWAVLAALGGPWILSMFLVQAARDPGKNKQGELYGDDDESGDTASDQDKEKEHKNAPPTITMLSYLNNDNFNDISLKRYHGKLKAVCSDLWFPADADDESKNMQRARDNYGSAADYLTVATRDHKEFRLVFKELVNYGYRRNLWGLKIGGIILSIVAVVISGLRVVGPKLPENHWLYNNFQIAPVVYFGICIAILWVWLFVVRKKWVIMTAEQHAYQLILACERLKSA